MIMAKEKKPENRFIQFLLEKLLSEKYREAFVGDLLESYRVRVADSRISAKIWLFFQLLSSFFSLLRKSFYGSVAMFKNYFLMAFRNLKKHRAYTLINVFGLTLGLSATILILLYLQFEISYDRFHENADSIYRICIRHIREGRSERESHVFTPPIGPDMKKDFPEVEDYVRMSTLRIAYLNVGNKSFKVNRIRYASPRLFEVFRLNSRQAILRGPLSILFLSSFQSRLRNGFSARRILSVRRSK
jgi:putative ABC transport system permease protein